MPCIGAADEWQPKVLLQTVQFFRGIRDGFYTPIPHEELLACRGSRPESTRASHQYACIKLCTMELAIVFCNCALLKIFELGYLMWYKVTRSVGVLVFTSLHTSWKVCSVHLPRRAERVLVRPSCAQRPGPPFCRPRQSWLSRTRPVLCWWRQTGAGNGRIWRRWCGTCITTPPHC